MKFCPKCKIEKTPEEFHKNSDSRDGLQWSCKSCQYQNLSPDAKAKHHKRSKEWKKENPDKVKRTTRRGHLKKYGLTDANFEAILFSQNNKCAICTLTLSDVKQVDVDHCHTTGKVRGILCNLCNTALGKFQDSEKVLISAIEYLRKNK